ncbi:hypothetical protein A3D05_05595 [Candidatus Gottesmanbacteria bacterium RIFCSPHIGHO2_02_FULL_40_24]|uniref:STAS/SEC14 domain-containing protein n=1 Tax=Candidatus Gottesmanbacteria bacterium RIFCSPHIGHO2_01_FULL_40_15 TaxID=1798376 RepID=A0A1F5Z6X9_9BACT|nr:MAG: hypothetical protein A2777_02230 [Candidatus Gottesmanbacteria bacterium RIFCSPHIGHO2_01_FULL_40_15]OGG16503.1 MAG: hypothetical protein A3D05_05595 [Candidatus Gottesmanbacteria bacterium RIFCSPHIGHO2_02_FULL_40_24]OGG22581.1 MAG: hypothetical protein A3B48_02070 [Candidatus Gottesmanbacteria bacterium RIFCSPLOWO2_01_FULL_40_10]OGG25616.1 MAG: hypothetical protein A3E42_04745 [Candidatus Gottesmanbacteria bacterium RIFCSPHIGHO2_12_FULL_40_13]OGG32620.1 MAG: hypothetical protein A3I80_0
MYNRVFKDKNDFINVIYRGIQNPEMTAVMIKQMNILITVLDKKKIPINIIVNLKKLRKSTAGSRKITVDALKRISFRKIAIYGANTFYMHLARFMFYAAGKSDKMSIFRNRSDAIDWLKE